MPFNEGKPSQKGYLGKTNNFLAVYRVVHELLFDTEMIGRLSDSMSVKRPCFTMLLGRISCYMLRGELDTCFI